MISAFKRPLWRRVYNTSLCSALMACQTSKWIKCSICWKKVITFASITSVTLTFFKRETTVICCLRTTLVQSFNLLLHNFLRRLLENGCHAEWGAMLDRHVKGKINEGFEATPAKKCHRPGPAAHFLVSETWKGPTVTPWQTETFLWFFKVPTS